MEVLKQRSQAGIYRGVFPIRAALQSTGFSGLYVGFGATLQREFPFAAIQYPLYEALKQKGVADEAICGSIAGGVSAFLTTPFDVIKTRSILSVNSRKSMFQIARECWHEGRMFAGGAARVAWISIGGFFFFGAFETVKAELS